MKKIIFFLITLFSIHVFSQNTEEIDSLRNVIKTATNDSIKMLTYNKLRRATYYSDAETSKSYTKNYLEYAIKLKDSHNIALGHFFLGNAEVVGGNYDEALTNYLISGNYYERKKDSKRLCSVLNSIGAVHEKTQNDSLSLVYYKRSYDLSKSLGDKRRSGIASINIGNIYNNLNEMPKAIKHLEDAISDLSENPAHQSFLILGEINLAGAYGKSNKYSSAESLYSSLLKKIDTLEDPYNYANVLRGMSNVLVQQNKGEKALPYAVKAFNKYTENNFKDERYQVMPELISAYKTSGNYKKALEVFDEYNSLKDSLLTENQDKNIAEAVQKYETDKKDTELKLLKVEGEKNEQRKQLYLILALAGLIIAGLLAFFGYKNTQKNKKLNSQKTILERTLDEKNVLLREVHHRVKNSFQIVSSLLYLQSENVTDEKAKIAIKEAENRVRSMVLVHQKLYNKDELVGINSQEYISDLIKDIFESHSMQKEPVTYNLNIESHVLDIETITPLGLILNELIINTIKHAFEGNEKGNTIHVDFSKIKDKLVLKVIDNGKGFEGEIKQTSFGITLMKALSKQLKASLNYESKLKEGTQAILSISKFNILS